MIWIYLIVITNIAIAKCQKPDFVLVVDDFDLELIGDAAESVKLKSAKPNPEFLHVIVKFEENIRNVTEQVRSLIQNGADLVADFTCEGLPSVQNVARHGQVPYVHVKSPVGQYVQAVADYLKKLEATDTVMMFNDKSGLEHAFCHVIDNVEIQVLLVEGLSLNNLNKLKNMTKRHSHYVVFANKYDANKVLQKAYDQKLMLGDSRWLFASQDGRNINFNEETNKITIIKPSEDFACKVAVYGNQECNCNDSYCFKIPDFRENYYQLVTSFFSKVTSDNPSRGVNMNILEQELSTGLYPMYLEDNKLQPDLGFDYYIKTRNNVLKVGNWEKNIVNITIKPPNVWERLMRRTLKIATILSAPYLYEAGTKNYLGDKEYAGFSMDFLKQLQLTLKFDYEFVFPEDEVFGIYDNKTIPYPHWNGLMGLSVNKSVDLILAQLSMTAERAAYVDYVTPFFDQTGIGILGRKPKLEASLFKFMSVLTAKVWWSIVASIVAISIAIWFVDKYSPYSGTNMGEPNCRKFTIRESLWFTLTSFTPQGGGEAPMSVSGRVLVAVYWLFVVLILATFSANLSALLTMERMESQINSLDDLAKDSNFNYTTLASSSMYQYFQNMAEAEEEIYDKWKDATLKSSSDYSRYRVWDYPVRERFKLMFEKIKESVPVLSIEEGIKRVLENEKGRFAFIADINTVTYTTNLNCELIQIGDVFGEHPYAIALTKGSSMLDEFNDRVMTLKREWFFENQMAVYWNSSKRKTCNAEKDNLGLYDLGGVFIAMAIGMSLALSALFVEVKLLAPKKIVVHPTGSRDSPAARVNTLMPDGKVVRNDVHICQPEPGCLGFRREIKINTITW